MTGSLRMYENFTTECCIVLKSQFYIIQATKGVMRIDQYVSKPMYKIAPKKKVL